MVERLNVEGGFNERFCANGNRGPVGPDSELVN